jgi:charged multivesicular body protein 2A
MSAARAARMSFLFGGAPPTTSELAARYRRHINRSVREIDREAARLQAEEKVLMAEVKSASGNNMRQSMQKAQAVVRARRTLNKFSQMKAQLQGIGMRIQSVKSTEALQRAVGSAVKMMSNFNKLTGGPQLVAELRELEKQNMTMTIQSEIIDEQLDAVFEEDNDEEAPEDVVMQVMEEAGVKLPAASSELLTIEERFEKLRPPGLRS